MSSRVVYYPCAVRWQQRMGVLLWVDKAEPEREALWANSGSQCPIFAGLAELRGFVQSQGWTLRETNLTPIDLDAVAAWVAGAGFLSPTACLQAWSLFDDLSAATGQCFSGNRKSQVRNEVFDLLYAESPPYPASSLFERPAHLPGWLPQHLARLRKILTQGLALWANHTFWL